MNHDNMKEYSLPFAAWELRLYLDTHPDDAEALAKYKAICAASGDKCNYACHTTDTVPGRHSREGGCGCEGNDRRGNASYTVRRSNGGNYGNGCGCENNGCGDDGDVYNVWSWIDGPWPWEPEAN